MHLIRHVETTLLDLFSKGYLRGTVHTSIGQEACAVGVISNIDSSKDIVYSNHRCHGHYISYSYDVKGLIAEIMGKEEGVCKGVGGSQHLQFKNFYSNGIQGAGMPVISGMCMAERLKGIDAIGVIFVGDGTFGEGSLYEALNIISLWSIPVLVVIENNMYAQSTPMHLQLSGSFKARAQAFDIDFHEADGMDVENVSQAANDCIDFIRRQSKPCLLLLNTYRYAPHSKGDDFRDPDEIAAYQKKDPLLKLRLKLDERVVEQIENENIELTEKIVSELIRK
jgi:TPP-dependent pyruvate/acetoin dehydrogenase alpha subunit